jgi:hypothetical protein
MPETRTKIAVELSAEELEEFCAMLAREQKLTGRRIQELAAERGIKIGHNSAAVFKKDEFTPWLERQKRRRESALMIAQHREQGHTTIFADAVAESLAGDLFDAFAAADIDIDVTTPEGIKAADALSKIVKRLQSEQRGKEESIRREKESERRLAEYEAKIKAANDLIEKSKRTGNGGLSKEALEEIELALGWKKPTEVAP